MKYSWLPERQMVDLHAHSEFSILDGVKPVSEFIKAAKEKGKDAFAFTEHGNMASMMAFYLEAIKPESNIKPIFGIEAYVVDDALAKTKEKDKQVNKSSHLVLLARNEEGLKNLLKISNFSWNQGFYYKPKVDFKRLRKFRNGLTALTACMGGVVSNAIRGGGGELDKALQRITQLKSIFRNNLYLEIQLMEEVYSSDLKRVIRKINLIKEESIRKEKLEYLEQNKGTYIDLLDRHVSMKEIQPDYYEKMYKLLGDSWVDQATVNKYMIKLSKMTNTKIILTGDCHYPYKGDHVLQDLIIRVGFTDWKKARSGGDEKSQSSGRGYYSQELYIKSNDDFERSRRKYHPYLPKSKLVEAIKSTHKAADKCNVTIPIGQHQLPSFDLKSHPLYEDGLTKEKLFRKIAWKGFFKNVKPTIPKNKLGEYKDRLKFELKTIEAANFIDYFLIIEDIVRWSRGSNIHCVARGSVAGSLVAYSIDITNIDPIQYKLLFERFLNPTRVSGERAKSADALPDVDLDFERHGRTTVKKYIVEKYGKDRVLTIGSYGTMGVKLLVKDFARVLDYKIGDNQYDYVFINKITGSLDINTKTIEEACDFSPDFKNFYEENQGWFETYVRPMIGEIKSMSRHAAGVLITPTPFTEWVPIRTQVLEDEEENTKVVISQWEDVYCERRGLLKLDILGVKQLDAFHKCISLIKKRHDIDLDLKNIEVDDMSVYKRFHAGDNFGVFQFNSNLQSDFMRKMKPSSIEDLCASNALLRPGPMKEGAHEKFIDLKHGIEKPEYHHECIIPYLESTYGLCIDGESKISTLFGKKEIRNLKSNDIIFNGLGKLVKARKVWKTGEKHVVKLITNGGCGTSLTEDHKILTTEGFVKSSQAAHVFRLRFKNKYQRKKSVLENNKLWLLGLFIADGCSNKSTSWYCSGSLKNNRNARIIKKILEEDFNGDANIFNHKTAKYVGFTRVDGEYKNEFYEFLRECGVHHKTKNEKNLPEKGKYNIYRMSDEELCRLVAGMWDGDGHIGRNAFYTTVNQFVLGQLRNILDILRITFYSHDNSCRIYIVDNERFNDIIVPFLKFKNSKKLDLTPFYGLLVHNGITDKLVRYRRENGQSLIEYCKKNKIPASLFKSKNKNKIRNIVKHFPELREKYINILRGDYCIHNIVSRKNLGIKDVYDIEVDSDDHSFISDNMIVHNCIYQEQTMQMANVLGGLSLAEADMMRSAIKKKDEKLMTPFKDKFVSGCKEKGLTTKHSEQVWEEIIAFSGYGFNKCLSGSTLVHRAGANQYQKDPRISIRELFIAQNSNTDWGNKIRRGKLKILQMCDDGKVRPGFMKKVHYNGRKMVYLIKTINGKEIKATINHRLLTDKGYRRTHQLKKGDNLVVMSEISGYIKKGYQSDRAKGKTYDNMGFPDRNKNPSWIDGRSVLFDKACEKVLIRSKSKCEHCGTEKKKGDRFEFAHIKTLEECGGDFKLRNSADNILYLCNSDHKKFDYLKGERIKRWNKGRDTHLDSIKSITKLGFEDTYDIEMCGQEHNFVANDIISHNSHAATYALQGYYCQWLKTYFPEEFYASTLQFASDDLKKNENIYTHRQHALEEGIKFVSPSIGGAVLDFDVTKKGSICWPITAIKGIGDKAGIALNNVGKVKTFEEFFEKLNKRAANKKVIVKLIQADVFRKFGKQEDILKKYFALRKDNVPDELEGLSEFKWKQLKDSTLGYISESYKDVLKDNFTNNIMSYEQYKAAPMRSRVCVGGIVTSFREHKARNGKMAFLKVEDRFEAHDLVVFASVYQGIKDKPQTGTVVEIRGVKGISNRGEEQIVLGDPSRDKIFVLG